MVEFDQARDRSSRGAVVSNTTTRTTVVLSFHKIGDPPADGWDTWNYISETIFVRFLEQLRDECFHVVDQHAFLAGMQNPARLPERTALLTFDDGYKSMLSVAQPLLNEFGFPSVLFVPTDYVGGHNTWDYGNEPEEPICDWDELRELQRRGVSIQSHSVSHRSFSDLDLGVQTYEIEKSKARLEDKLGTSVDTLAFPYGDPGKDVEGMERIMRRAGYRASFLYKGGAFELPTKTPFRVTRVPMGPDTDLAQWMVEP